MATSHDYVPANDRLFLEWLTLVVIIKKTCEALSEAFGRHYS
jgi:hypothetical protein